jgi:hypothetical protein
MFPVMMSSAKENSHKPSLWSMQDFNLIHRNIWFHLRGYNAMWSVESQPTFRRNISPLQPWRWRRHDPPKRWLTFNRLLCVISQKTELFVTTAVKTSNPTQEYITSQPALLNYPSFLFFFNMHNC